MNTRSVALITGASNGIGLELAKLFAQDGYNLVLVARSHDKLKIVAEELEKKHGIQVKNCVKDLSVSSTPDEIVQSLKSEMIKVDVLVNNAGFGWRGDYSKMELSDALEMIQVNITALAHLTRLMLPEMLERKSGKILNVASTAAFQPGPLMSVYYATKAFVLSFSLALWEELKGTGVIVSALCPGPTATGFGQRAGFGKAEIFNGALSMDSYTVALKGYKGFKKGKPIIVTGKRNWLGTQLVRLLPRTVPGKLIKRVQQKRGI